ncbi:MAG: response regulator transcription factor [Anaerolineaceae bacterium]|nr:response regulator transcription factor [Anaerolineaceae bacterium]
MNKKKIRLLLVDDQSLFREGLKTLLSVNEDFDIVAEAQNGEEAVRLAVQERPDVVLMDVRMPVLDGVSATKRIRATLSDQDIARVIILTTFDDDEAVFDGLRAGAMGYLLKDVSSEKLFEAIYTTSRGESFLQPSITSKLLAEFSRLPKAKSKSENMMEVPLSNREMEILKLIATGASNREIADALLIAEGTVKNHVSSILGKMDARDRMQAVIKGQQMGIL